MVKRAVPTFGAPPQQVTEEDAELFMETATDIALTALQGLLASGHYENNPKAAVAEAWQQIVPEFLRQQAGFPAFLDKIYGSIRPGDAAAAAE